ncbi:MAG: alpha/beta hydrolase [Lachnospiraceae bacterium]|nr:alpha/beta hydrolase [Lachnospiraceae bacterium]
MSKMSELVRAAFKESDDIRDAGLTTPEDIQRYDSIQYGPDPDWQVLDVCRPKAAQGKMLPVIVSVHGGGWVYGDKERYQYYCMNLAQRGFAVVNFSYRLAPEFKFPCPVEDTNLVFHWTLAHKEEYGFDTSHIFGVGDSAGGHNLALYSAICTNPALAAQFPFRTPKDFSPTAIALNCGAYEISFEDNGGADELTQMLMDDFLPEHGTKEELERICVLNSITPQYPPTFFMTATGDFRQEQASLLYRVLMANSIPFIFRFYGDAMQKPLGHVFHCNIKSEDAKLCNDEECAFFKEFLK